MVKRIVDLLGALIGLMVFSPILLVVSVFIEWTIGSPILFRQQRPGLQGKPFTLIKFRTMTNATDSDGNLLPNSERMTRLGRFLRRTSLDELPELLNVLKGDMSLVGPRPLLMRYLPFYTERERLRFSVKPGITGWAQIHGRNLVAWDERLALDVWYVEHCALLLDIRILFSTVGVVMKRQGVVDPGILESDLAEERGCSMASH